MINAFQSKIISTLIGLALLPMALAAGETANFDGFKNIREMGGIEEYLLEENGLTVLLMEDHSAPVATFMVTYLVGSRNEVTGTTGATHILEHLMFKGTKKFNKDDQTDPTRLLQNVGALINATTWYDRTNYYANLPIDHLEMTIEIEADRMRNLLLHDEDRQSEMTVVRNEFERGENDPVRSLLKEIYQAAFVAHPYHHSTIGWRSDIEKVAIEKLRQFYDTFYWPNNAIVSVIGDFQKKEVLETIMQYYGTIPSSPLPIPEMYTEEPEQRGPRRVTLKRNGQLGVVSIAHKIPKGLHEDTFALSVLERILSSGKNSRFYKLLMDKGLAVNVFLWNFPFHDPGLFAPFIFMTPGTSHESVENIILEEYENIKTNGVGQEEVDRAISQIQADTAYARDGSFSIASVLNETIAMGDWTFYFRYSEKVAKVTPADVRRVAETYLVEDHSTTGYFIPEIPGGGSQGDARPQQFSPGNSVLYYRNAGISTGTALAAAAVKTREAKTGAASASTANTPSYSTGIVQNRIHGIDVISMKTEVQDVVTIVGSLPAGDVFSPQRNSAIADLTGNMLDKGTMQTGKFELAEKLERVGASLNFSVGPHRLSISGKCLKKDLPLLANLLAEQLREPAFDAEELEKLKKLRTGELKQLLEDPNHQASDALARLVFPQGHPNHHPSVEEVIKDLESVTVEDLRAFHQSVYGPKSMILVAVGDLQTDVLHATIKSAFKKWSGGIKIPSYERAGKHNRGHEETVHMVDKPSVSVRLAMASDLQKNDPDYLDLMMGTYILGGNFSARLMQTVRDEEGLTYGISSRLSNDLYSDGLWRISATFAPQLLEKGLASTHKQLNLWYEEGVTEEELKAKKTTLIGSYKVRLANTGGMAGRIHSFAQMGRPVSYLDQYPKDLEALQLKFVNAAIKRYLNPKDMITVMAGSVEPVEALNE